MIKEDVRMKKWAPRVLLAAALAARISSLDAEKPEDAHEGNQEQ